MPVRVELDADTETPVSAFLKLSRGAEQAFLFESVEGGERSARFSFLGVNPRRVLRFEGDGEADVFAALEAALGEHRAAPVPGTPPFSGGLVGFVGYDAIRRLEPRVPIAGPDELGFPEAVWMDFDTVVAFDGVRHTVQVIAEARRGPGDEPEALYAAAVARIEAVIAALAVPLEDPRPPASAGPVVLTARTRRADFEAAVARAREHVAAGDCQQIVVSQRFDGEVSSAPFELYRALRRVNPSPYLFFLKDGDRALIGSSPETLVRLQDGELSAKPIAGTRRRGRDAAEDAAFEAELVADEKENAEHAMLVDLGRNDVGRVAAPGTVRVSSRCKVERYSHVMHLVSEVRGRLGEGLSAVDVLRATFPAGTVSGAPKVRAMELIDALEPARRGPYAGCVGYLDRRGNMDVAITIRTLMQRGRRISVQAGAGVVFDSEPAAEYRETVNKARALLVAVAQAEGRSLARGADDVQLEEGDRRPFTKMGTGLERPREACPHFPKSTPVPFSGGGGPRVLVLDNYDSFTFNLVQYLAELGASVEVVRNDAIEVPEVIARAPQGVLVSPGPSAPEQAGISIALIQALAGKLPVLGVCLGHQAIGVAFGAPVIRNDRIVHGKASLVRNTGVGSFAGLPAEFLAARYHSLVIDPTRIPGELEVTARTDAGEVMAVRHRAFDVEGVQFHPESILTEHGKPLLQNWLARLSPRRTP